MRGKNLIGASCGAGFGAGCGAGVGARVGTDFGRGVCVGFGAGVGTGIGAGVGACFGHGGDGLSRHAVSSRCRGGGFVGWRGVLILSQNGYTGRDTTC